MNVNDGVAAVEFFHDGTIRRIAQPRVVVAREQTDAIGLERVVCVSDFLQSRVDVRQRHRREKSKPSGVVRHEFCSVLVACSREAGGHSLIAKPQAGIRDRNHRRSHATTIHIFNGLRRSPRCVRGLQKRPSFHLVHPHGGSEMMMNVNTIWLRGGSSLRKCHKKRAQEGSPINVAHESSRLSELSEHCKPKPDTHRESKHLI